MSKNCYKVRGHTRCSAARRKNGKKTPKRGVPRPTGIKKPTRKKAPLKGLVSGPSSTPAIDWAAEEAKVRARQKTRKVDFDSMLARLEKKARIEDVRERMKKGAALTRKIRKYRD